MNNIFRLFWQILYKLGLRYEKRNIFPLYKELRCHDALSIEEIRLMQLKKLKEILCYAGANIPFYQRIFQECGFNPYCFTDYGDLEKLPYIDKNTVQQYADEFLPRQMSEPKIERKTGGSTGNKLKIYYNAAALDVTAAVVVRCLEWTGKKIGDREIHFSSNVNLHIPWRDSFREWAKCMALHRKNIVLDILSPQDYEKVLSELRRFHAVVVQGFPSIGFALAVYAEKTGQNVRGIFSVYESTGERLFDFQREKIESVFGCKVFNRYGNAEFGIIAYECKEHNGMHIQSDVVYAESPVIAGMSEIVVTTLTNKMMPLIRYRTGDLGVVTEEMCKCGLPYPRIINMEGRIHDFIYMDEEIILSTTYLLDLLDKYGGFKDFQVFYDNDGKRLEFYLLPEDDLQLDKLRAFQQDLFYIAKGKVAVDIHLMPELKLLPSGKFRYVLNENVIYDIASQVVLHKEKEGTIDCYKGCAEFM